MAINLLGRVLSGTTRTRGGHWGESEVKRWSRKKLSGLVVRGTPKTPADWVVDNKARERKGGRRRTKRRQQSGAHTHCKERTHTNAYMSCVCMLSVPLHSSARTRAQHTTPAPPPLPILIANRSQHTFHSPRTPNWLRAGAQWIIYEKQILESRTLKHNLSKITNREKNEKAKNELKATHTHKAQKWWEQ
jgi:hypothetical protein